MPITQEQFVELVARLERHPRLYQFRLGAFASLGYLHVLGILARILLVIGLAIASLMLSSSRLPLVKNLVVSLAVLAWVVVRSMWVRVEAPQGLELERKDYPELGGQEV